MSQLPTEVTISEEEQKKLFTEARKKPFSAQCVLFINVNWSNLKDEDKQTVVLLFLKFCEQNEKFNAKENIISYPAFCKVLQQLDDKDARIKKVLEESGDRSTMSKKFKSLGFKLKGDVSVLEGLLFLFNINVSSLFSSPLSPGDARLRKANLLLNNHKKKQEDELNKISQLEKQLDEYVNNNKPMQATKCRNELNKVKNENNNNQVQYKRELKKLTKEVTASEEFLLQEKSTGTEADKWWEIVCKDNHKKFHKY